MDQGDFEQRLQVPTGSKRPSPSPSEAEEDREIKKLRTQLSNGNEDWGFQSNEPGFPFTDFPSEDFFGNELGTFWSNQDVHGMSFNTVTGLDMGYDGSAAFTTIHTDFGTNLGDGLATAALNVNPEARAEIGLRGFSQYPYEGSESHVDRHVLDGGVYADQYGDLITGDYGGHNWINDIPVSQSEALVASHDSPSGIGALKSVESIPIRRTQGYEPPAQSLAASFPKESVDVRQDCDTCFGVVGSKDTSYHLGLSDSSKGDSNSHWHVIVHAGRWDTLYSCRPRTSWALLYSSGSGFRYTRRYLGQLAAPENTCSIYPETRRYASHSGDEGGGATIEDEAQEPQLYNFCGKTPPSNCCPRFQN